MSTQNDRNLQKVADMITAERITSNPFVQYGQYVRKIVEDGNTTYIGYSLSAVKDDEPKWVIKKLEVAGILTSITFAVEVKWEGYASHTYV